MINDTHPIKLINPAWRLVVGHNINMINPSEVLLDRLDGVIQLIVVVKSGKVGCKLPNQRQIHL